MFCVFLSTIVFFLLIFPQNNMQNEYGLFFIKKMMQWWGKPEKVQVIVPQPLITHNINLIQIKILQFYLYQWQWQRGLCKNSLLILTSPEFK